ncbi:MAG: nitrogen regulation protein NR(I) [Granulosicoccaceae bacterium]
MSEHTNKQTIWIIDDDESIRWVIKKALEQADFYVNAFDSADEVLGILDKDTALPPDAIISDIQMPGTDGIALLQSLKASHPETPILIMTAYSDLDSTVSAFDGGAFDYIAKPFDIDKLIEQVKRACISATSIDSVESETDNPVLLGDSPAMQSVYNAIGRLSRSKTTVLIGGESGTGKELIAKALHRHSPRASQPFITLNMAAIPSDQMESELFGIEKAAFTHDTTERIGRFEQANGGTVFLDEIGDMPLALQTRLLRVLEDGQFYRIGGNAPVMTDVRIVAASLHALAVRVDEGKFREDLFHRLNVIRIDAPPLRDRREDIPRLLQHFLDQAATDTNEQSKTFDADFSQHVMALAWPGNVRELQNTAHWLTIMAGGNELKVSDLPEALLAIPDNLDDDWESAFRQWVVLKLQSGEQDLLAKATPAMETILIQCALRQTQNKRQDAARLLGWGRNTLTRKIKELGLESE